MQEAYDLAPSPRTAGQLGLAELAVGYWLEADRHLDDALAAPTHPWVAKNRAALVSAQKSARSHLVSVTLDGEPAGAEVMANGQPVGRLPLTNVALPEGRITFAVRAAGYEDQTKQVTLTGGAQSSVRFSLLRIRAEPVEKRGRTDPEPRSAATASSHPAPADSSEKAAAPEPTEAKPEETWASKRTLPIVLGAAAGLALGVGIWQHLAWLDAAKAFERVDGCYAALPMHGTDVRCPGLYADVVTHQTWTVVGYSAAGLLALGSGISYWLGSNSSKPSAENTGLSVMRVALVSQTGSLSVWVTGRF